MDHPHPFIISGLPEISAPPSEGEGKVVGVLKG